MRIKRTWKNAASILLVQPIRIPLLSFLYVLDKGFEKLSWWVNGLWGFFYDILPGIDFERTPEDIAREEARRKELIDRIKGSRP